MVEILCPHCEEEIELDDDASGEFGCPYCEGEFEWNMEPDVEAITRSSQKGEQLNYSSELSSIHPTQWLGHALSLFVFVFLIICLTSSNYYSISKEGDSDSMKFGRSSFTEGETTSTYSGAVAEFEDLDSGEFCAENPNEFACIFIESVIEYYNSWSMAGSILGVFLVLALLSSISVIASRGLLLLDHLGIMQLQERVYIASIFGKRFLPFIIGGLLIIGMALYMLISPGTELFEGVPEEFGGGEFDGGFGLIVWLSFLVAIVYPVLSLFERELPEEV